MKKIIFGIFVFGLLAGCSDANQNTPTTIASSESATISYQKIPQSEAKKIMDSGEKYILLDVRSEEEFNERHIPKAIVIPHDEIKERAEQELSDKNALILVYCRSGSRSKKAIDVLLQMGYTNVKDFGGINDWPYETE
jgi:phage shock protein E